MRPGQVEVGWISESGGGLWSCHLGWAVGNPAEYTAPCPDSGVEDRALYDEDLISFGELTKGCNLSVSV
jgi:hypothetical protein